MAYAATLEPVAYVLRIHASGRAWGSPYYGSATVTVDDAGIATIRGLTLREVDFDAAMWRAIITALRAAGCTGMLYKRRTGGRVRTVRQTFIPNETGTSKDAGD